MGLTVAELLRMEVGVEMKVVCGEQGLSNEIKGVTIIEAPDIVRWIDGGEVLLTALYAFKSCSLEEFRDYIYELKNKSVSALVLKRGRVVEDADRKIELLHEFSNANAVPVIEVPFEVSFQAVMSLITERLFGEEITRLKFFKTTHDNFSALALSKRTSGNIVEDVLDMLEKLIRNPVAIYNGNMTCLGTTNFQYSDFKLKKTARKYDPGILTNYRYLKQRGECDQYIVQVELSFGMQLFLVVTEADSEFGNMDCIAMENAIVALQYEFSRQYAVSELEKKFQTDILHNIVNGKVRSIEELRKSSRLLGIPIDASYRVAVLGVTDDGHGKKGLDAKIRYAELLEHTAAEMMPGTKVYRDLEKVVVIQAVDETQTQEEYRGEFRKCLSEIQKEVVKGNKHLRVKAGVGKVVGGVIHLQKSCKEANDAYSFIDIAGEVPEESGFQMMLFSDLGIFKLLCQLDDPEQLLEYVPESLQKLYNYKKPQRDDLIITLKTYLDRNQNLSRTAQDLYVHYKTAAYRVEKITRLTGMDFDNANEVLAVRIGLVVYKMIENYNRKIV